MIIAKVQRAMTMYRKTADEAAGRLVQLSQKLEPGYKLNKMVLPATENTPVREIYFLHNTKTGQATAGYEVKLQQVKSTKNVHYRTKATIILPNKIQETIRGLGETPDRDKK